MAEKTSAARKQNPRKPRKKEAVKENTRYTCDLCGKFVSLKAAHGCKQTDLICGGKSTTEHEDYFD